MEEVVALVGALPVLEQRRLMPTVQLTDLVARVVWPKGKTPPTWREWLPAYARDENTHPVPAEVTQDVALGVRLGLVDQELFDAVQQLRG